MLILTFKYQKKVNFKMVVKDNTTGIDIQTKASITSTNDSTIKLGFNLSIKERKKAIAQPKEFSDLSAVTTNVLKVLEENQLLNMKPTFQSLTETDVTQFINAMFDSLNEDRGLGGVTDSLDEAAELDYADFIELP